MIEYNKNKPLRCFFGFAGYDSQMMALQRLKDNFPDFAFECVGWSEIDKNAITAHNACFPNEKDKNYGDISKIDWDKVPDFDLFTMSSPCQDFSLSGKRRGGEEGSGTRSSLLWECTRAIEIKRPRYVFFENVKGLITGSFVKGFHKWQARLEGFGYSNFTQVLNAKDYGVPQNRERVFMVSILRTEKEPNPSYYFPKPFKLKTRIKDVLEKEVDESFFLSDKALEYFCRVNNDKTHNHNFQPKDGQDVAFTIRCASGQRVDDNFLKLKNSNTTPPRWITEDIFPMLECADGSSPTVTARCGNAGIVNMIDLGHYPIQGVLVQGHYEESKD